MASVDPALAERLALALAVVHDGMSNPDARTAATQFLSEFQEQSGEVAMYGLHFARLDTDDDAVRHFGLHLLEHFVKHRWNACSDEAKAEMKAAVLGKLIADCARSLLEERHFVKQKIGSLVTEVAKREWPQQWPDLIPCLLELCALGPSQTELVLVVLQALAEDIIGLADQDDIETRRRQDLNRALTAVLPTILPILARVLAANAPLCLGVAEPPAENSILTTAVIRTLSVYVEWSPLPMIYENNFLPMFAELLHSRPHRKAACECLLLVMARKGAKEDRMPLLSTFENMRALTSSVPAPTGTPDDAEEETYEFVKRLCQVLVCLGSQQLCPLWAAQGQKAAPAHFDNYLATMYAFSDHPSLLVCSFTLPVWIALLRHDFARSNELLKVYNMPLLDLTFRRCLKIECHDGEFNDDLEGLFCMQDFNGEDDLNQFYGIFRSHLMDIARLVSAAVPSQAILFAAERLSELMQVPVSPADLAADGTLSTESHIYRRWDGMSFIWEGVIAGAMGVLIPEIKKGGNSRTNNVRDILDQCFTALLALETDDPHLLEFKTGFLQALIPVLAYLPAHLPKLVNSLFVAISYRSEEDRAAAAAGAAPRTTGLSDSSRVRRKGCAALIALCNCDAPCLLESLESVCGQVLELLKQPSFFNRERKLLFEAMLRAGNLLPSLEQHVNFLKFLLDPLIAEWASEEMSQALSSGQALAAFAQLTDVGSINSERRMRLSFLANAFHMAMRVTQKRKLDDGSIECPCAEQAVGIFPNLVALVGALHALWVPGCLPPDFAGLLDLRRSELAAYLAGAGKNLSREYSEQELWCDKIQLWLQELREACYVFFDYACRHGLLYRFPSQDAIFQSFFVNLESMHKRHLKELLRHVVAPALRNCPDENLPALASPLAFVYNFFFEYLSNECAAVMARGPVRRASDLQSGTVESELREIVEDKLLDDVLVDLMSHFNFVFKVTQGVTPRVLFALASAITEPIFRTLQSALTWHSSAAARTAASVLAGLVPLISDVGLAEFMTTTVFSSALRALSLHGQHSECEVAFLTLISDINSVFNGSPGVRMALQSIEGIPPGDLDGLAKIASSSKKKQRTFFKKMLSSIIGIDIGQAGRRRDVKILDLPGKLFFLRDSKPPPEDPDFDSNTLFGDS
eukprot:m.71045 g.71045  ORF g.71045 m.71045 type:complete len:1148 (+) comp7914_c0_seq2:84-3527(+)